MKIGTQFIKRAEARSGTIPPSDLGPDLRQGDDLWELQHDCGSLYGFKISANATPHTVIPMKIGTQFTERAGARSGAIQPSDLGPDLRQGDDLWELQHDCGSRCGFKISAIATPHTVIPTKVGTQFTKRAEARSGAIPPFDLGPDLRQGDALWELQHDCGSRCGFKISAIATPHTVIPTNEGR